MGSRTGIADLPLHRGHVPRWLAERMTALAGAIVEAILLEFGPRELLTRLSDPAWFQSFGCVLGMDWHSSGMTTAVMGALKRALSDRGHELGLWVCGGRGRHSRKTPTELEEVGERTGLDGQRLARTSRLVAKVDNTAVADGHQLYLHSFVVAADGSWVVVQQGMCPERGTARRYHWRSDTVRDFVDEPHEGIVGENVGEILNLTDHRAASARQRLVELSTEQPDSVLAEFRRLKRLRLPGHHAVRAEDVNPRRLEAVLRLTRDRPPAGFEELLLTPGLGPRTLEALALLSEVVYGTPTRFEDPARFAFAHGGKDGHPHPVLTQVMDESLATLRRALEAARIGHTEKLKAFRRLESQLRRLEAELEHPATKRPGGEDPVSEAIRRGWNQAPSFGGRTVGRPASPLQDAGDAGGSRRPTGGASNPLDGRRRGRGKSARRPEQLFLPGLEPD